MLSFLFGKKRKTRRRSVKRKSSRKLPARLIKRCKKYRIKCTKKVGGRRVYKKISVIRKLISNKLKKRRLPSNTYSGSLRNRKKVRKTRKVRRSRFGNTTTITDERRVAGEIKKAAALNQLEARMTPYQLHNRKKREIANDRLHNLYIPLQQNRSKDEINHSSFNAYDPGWTPPHPNLKDPRTGQIYWPSNN